MNTKYYKRITVPALSKPSHSINMYQQCYKQITEAIANWSTADVRAVPGIMFQIRFGSDETDPNTEYQLNWFIDCSETFIHNHRHSFISLCLEGEYIEKQWEVIDDQSGDTTYQFYRKSGNDLDLLTKMPGALHQVKERHHFPGNQLHVTTEEYHSVSPKVTSNSQVVTFLSKQKHASIPYTYILSSSLTVNAPSDEIRPATPDERLNMYNKLQHILSTKFHHKIQVPQESHRCNRQY